VSRRGLITCRTAEQYGVDMCQAIPRRIVAIGPERLQVDYDGAPRWVEAHGLTHLAVGDYVIVYAGQALQRVATAEAEEMLAWYAELASLLEQSAG
jgi:hydrogenase assembly chaperone HypC/HupF